MSMPHINFGLPAVNEDPHSIHIIVDFFAQDAYNYKKYPYQEES